MRVRSVVVSSGRVITNHHTNVHLLAIGAVRRSLKAQFFVALNTQTLRGVGSDSHRVCDSTLKRADWNHGRSRRNVGSVV